MHKFIFSDIDGCIINNSEPDFALINETLQNAINNDFIIVLTTAKTTHELIRLNKILNLPGPFIIENGAGILFKNNSLENSGAGEIIQIEDYKLLKLINHKPDINILKSICDKGSILTQMNNIEVTKITGLSDSNAILAKTRYFTEPIYIENLDKIKLKLLKSKLRKHKFYFIQTKRFLHVCTNKKNHKGYAIKFLIEKIYHYKNRETYAIGDSVNDFSMLNFCDTSFYITDDINLRAYPDHWQIMAYTNFLGWQKAINIIIQHAQKI